MLDLNHRDMLIYRDDENRIVFAVKSHSNNALYWKTDPKGRRKFTYTRSSISELLADFTNTRTYLHVRGFGSRQQATMMLEAADYIYSTPGSGDVYIGSPRAVHKTTNILLEFVFYGLVRLFNSPPRLGGWRPMGVVDYKLMSFLATGEAADPTSHPAACALDFLLPQGESRHENGEYTESTKKLLTELLLLIEDPRWFQELNNVRKETQLSCNNKLSMFLGVTPKNMRIVMEKLLLGQKPNYESSDYARRLGSFMRLCFGEPEDYEALCKTDSLAAHIFTHLSGDKPDAKQPVNLAKALQLTLNAVVHMLNDYWLHETTPSGWELFVPEYFLEAGYLSDETRKQCVDKIKLRRSAFNLKLGFKPIDFSYKHDAH